MQTRINFNLDTKKIEAFEDALDGRTKSAWFRKQIDQLIEAHRNEHRRTKSETDSEQCQVTVV